MFVLILVVVDDGLVLYVHQLQHHLFGRLNPYCNGQWYRTRRC